MSDTPYLPPSRLDARREQVIAELSTHFAHDNLDTAEFERRLDEAFRATSLVELEKLKSDLPALPTPAAAATPSVRVADSTEVRDRQTVFAIMGGTERKGDWVPARTVDAIAVMGGVELDFREARFAPGVTQVNALAIMGGIGILVPPGLRVESTGVGIMGGFESLDQAGDAEPGAPVLRVSGLALMGGVEITQRLPGESAGDAKRRLREERRALRDQERKRLQQGE